MSDLLELPSALDNLVERGDALHTVIEKVGEYAPAVAELMETLATISDQVTEERMNEVTDQSLDLRRTNVAIFVALLHDAVVGLGAVLFSMDLDEWLGEREHDALPGAQGAVYSLIESLSVLANGIRPGERE
ncbi:hypothetical protein ETD83_20920 [Actinomadura soli]|uniref:Uncharacterized protein n=1 Tax=Actinomadura soli TaxID=2508997 RepID=A0A5C4J9P0_9ACTN|nr:hypothetical protein [Actinomadura soli]TMQ96817.1 hypothetical protein ETD83_20920 [Actinomadura soli]